MADLTPTEALMIEVLVARRRLGEALWTFDLNKGSREAARKLAAKGYVTYMSGNVEHTFRVALTAKGETEFMATDYTPPRDAGDEKAAWEQYEKDVATRWIGGNVPSMFQDPFLAGYRAGRRG